MRESHTHIPALETRSDSSQGSTRISTVWRLPEVMRDLGVDLGEVLEAAGVRPDIFDDRENRIAYIDLGRLLLACEQQSNCDHVAMLINQRSQLTDFGLAGQAALCGETVGEGLQLFIDHFNLHSSASTATAITSGGFTRFVYAITEQGMTDTRPFQLGAMTVAFNILRDLCGPGWLPAVVTFASRSPTNPRPCQKFFRAPLRFDSEESALVFESHWLGRALPPVDALVVQQIEAAVRARRASILTDFPATVRNIVRKQLSTGDCSMDHVAKLLGIHRRTLDRQLQRHGVQYGELVESVKNDVARQLLRDTNLQVQHVSEALRFSSSANFATAFRRWTGVTPSEYRRRAR